MKWMTTSYVHLDRVATAWLIRRFIDPSAEFLFIDRRIEERLVGTGEPVLFGMSGVPLSAHDHEGTAFAKVMRAYSIDNSALTKLERIVAAGVRHALNLEHPDDETEDELVLGTALDYLGVGLGIAMHDEQHVESAMAIYDGVYTVLRVWELPSEVRGSIPKFPPDRVEYLRLALR